MKKNLQKNVLISFYMIIVILFLINIYYYPRTRDEFYYLASDTNIFTEYKDSYLFVNARIGQFFSNLAGRNLFFKLIISCFTFVSFFYFFYLTVFRKTFSTADLISLKNLGLITGIFIFLINYFGEMFFYVPYSTNYTLLNVFYLLCIFILTCYFIYDENYLKKFKIPLFIIFILGIFIGLGNEHVPPALLFLTGLMILIMMVKNKKFILPSKEIIVMASSIFIGYLLLFFAPANKVRFQKEGKKAMGFNSLEYYENLKSIFKLYYHYNFMLLVFFGFVVFFFVFYARKKMQRPELLEIGSYLFLAIIGILITAYSPIVGTRLLFFSNVLLIIIGLIILFRNNDFFQNKKRLNFSVIISLFFLVIYFSSAFLVTFNANSNYNTVIREIKEQSKISKDVIIKNKFHYQNDFLGIFNRKILLDNGNSYIDDNEKDNNSIERNLMIFYNIKTLKTKE